MITKITNFRAPITSTTLLLLATLIGSGCVTTQSPDGDMPASLSAALDGGAATSTSMPLAAARDLADEEGAELFVVRDHAPDALFLVADRTAYVGEWVLSHAEAPRDARVRVRRMHLDREALAHLVAALPPDVALVQIGEARQVHREDLAAALRPLRLSVYPKSLQIGAPLF